MNYYFGPVSNSELPFLGIVHISLMVITFISVFLIYKFRHKIKKSDLIDKLICIVLITNQLVYNIGAIVTGNYSIEIHLPLPYCFIIGYLYCYMLWFKKEKMFNFLYYSAFFCTFSVILFQDTAVSFDRYDFILLIVSHHFLFISLFYTLFIHKYEVNKKGYLKMLIYSLMIYFAVYVINQILNTNYIFSDKFPDFMYDILPFLDLLPTLVWMLLFTVPVVFLSYYPIKKIHEK